MMGYAILSLTQAQPLVHCKSVIKQWSTVSQCLTEDLSEVIHRSLVQAHVPLNWHWIIVLGMRTSPADRFSKFN